MCSAKSIEQYWKKFSAPLLDRVDLRTYVENDSEVAVEDRGDLTSTTQIREGIATAVKIQRSRQGIKNAKLVPQDIANFCKLDSESQKLLDDAINRYGFSPRAISSCLKVARTIADISSSPTILPPHLEESITYRKLCSDLVPEI